MSSPKKCVNQKIHFLFFRTFFYKTFLHFFVVSKKNTNVAQLKEQETKLQKIESEKSAFVEKIKLLEEKLSKQDAAVSFKDLNFEMPRLDSNEECENFHSRVGGESDEGAKLFLDLQRQRNRSDELECMRHMDCHEQNLRLD